MTGSIEVSFRPSGDMDDKPKKYQVDYILSPHEVRLAVGQYVGIRFQAAMRGGRMPDFITGYDLVKE